MDCQAAVLLPREDSSSSETLDEILPSAHGECHDGKRGGFVGWKRGNTGVADVKIGNIVALAEAVGHRLFWISAHSAGAGLMLAVAGHLR